MRRVQEVFDGDVASELGVVNRNLETIIGLLKELADKEGPYCGCDSDLQYQIAEKLEIEGVV